MITEKCSRVLSLLPLNLQCLRFEHVAFRIVRRVWSFLFSDINLCFLEELDLLLLFRLIVYFSDQPFRCSMEVDVVRREDALL